MAVKAQLKQFKQIDRVRPASYTEQLSHRELHPMVNSQRPLEELATDSVVDLPLTAKGHNALLTVTTKFS